MPAAVVAAGVATLAVLVVVMVAVNVGVVAEMVDQQRGNCRVRLTADAAVELYARLCKRRLSAAADARCESFVAGGPFDHSGMTTRSEICAAGPLGSASAVCTGWQGSPAHYANIMEPSFTSMGVGCWFCSTAEGNYTYWTVTFQ